MTAKHHLIALMVASIGFTGVGLVESVSAAESTVVPVRKAVRVAAAPNRASVAPRMRMVTRTDLAWPWGIASCTYCRGYLLGVGFGF